jgi:hypothetical protein
MGLALVPGLFDIKPQTYSPPQFVTIDAAGEMAGAVFRVPSNGNIAKVGVYVGYVSTSKPLRVSLQTVDAATGFPTGTMYKGSVQGVLASIASNTFYMVTLGTQATAAVKNDLIAIVAEWNSVDFGNCRIMVAPISSYSTLATQNVGGAGWAKTNNSPFGALEYSDGSYYHISGVLGCVPTSPSFNVNTAGADEYGNIFNLPV